MQALLGWGERRRADGSEGYVVDPEYQSNMEWPRTTLASTAGVRSGYGLGIFSTITLPYHVLGHNGGIDGFLSAYGYSPSRDVGYVVLLNSTHAPAALTRLTSLAIRYLKREVEPPPKPTLAATRDELQQFAGYYRDTSPRNAILAGVQFLRDGRTDRRRGRPPGADARLRPVHTARAGESRPLQARARARRVAGVHHRPGTARGS